MERSHPPKQLSKHVTWKVTLLLAGRQRDLSTFQLHSRKLILQRPMSQQGITGRSLAAFRKWLRAWYARHKRAMPWRGTRDAYRVWVSEVMLQQTRVAAVEPYYRRFVKKFPTLRALARARSEDVLKLWAGLGYYSRARNLHRAAREMVTKHGGKFPREVEQALALPGVGRYTAAAVLSIAYGEPLAVVDGNVARVVARLEAVRGDVKEAGRWRKLEERAQELMEAEKPKIEKRKTNNGEASRKQQAAQKAKRRQVAALHTRAGEWNQAMMELGATVCTPRAPRCAECPVAKWCRARKLGLVEKIPSARKKRAAEKIEIAVAVLVDARGRTLLVKPEKAGTNGLFSGMWQFPAVEIKRVARKKKSVEMWKCRSVEVEKTDAKGEWVELEAVKHSVTYREITLRPYVVRVPTLPAVKCGRAVPLAKVSDMAVSSATRKIARAAILDSLKKTRSTGAPRQ
jgi:A/G-specific adenine glycosylase